MVRIAIGLTAIVLAGFVYLAFREPPDSIVTRMDTAVRKAPATAFQPPQAGDRIRIELLSGTAREGVIRSLDANSVMIETEHGEISYPRRNIAASSRKLLFRADYEGVPTNERPSMILDEELVRLLSEDEESRDELEMNRNAQYVISGTNAIVIYGSHRMTTSPAP